MTVTGASADLKERGIAVHAITAEPGGTDVVTSRLAARGAADLAVPVHCDPDHKLLSPPADELYVIEQWAPSPPNDQEHPYMPYMMVQPALVVLDSAGQLVQKWAWKTMGQAEGTLWSTKVPHPDGEGEVPIVIVRPKTEDIGPALTEGRTIGLKVVM